MLFRCLAFLEEREARASDFDSPVDAVGVKSRSYLMHRLFAWEELRLELQATVLQVLAVAVAVRQRKNFFLVEEEVVEEAEEMLAPMMVVLGLLSRQLVLSSSNLLRSASVAFLLRHPAYAQSRDDSNVTFFSVAKEAKAAYR